MAETHSNYEDYVKRWNKKNHEYKKEWGKNNYKRFGIYLHPEMKEQWEIYMKKHGYKSLNSFIIYCVEDVIERDGQ